jgi:hypothetical protein
MEVTWAEFMTFADKLCLRPWTSVDDYRAVAADTMERVKEALDRHGVKFSVALQ